MTTGTETQGAEIAHSATDQFVPVRKSDILAALAAHGALRDVRDRDAFAQVCRTLAAIYHTEYFDLLEKLHGDYFYFSPDLDPNRKFDATLLERAYQDLMGSFIAVLIGANFVEIPHDEIERAHREHAVVHIKTQAPIEDFREVRFFRRGRHRETFEVKRWYGLRRRNIEVEVYDDVIMLVAMKSSDALVSKRGRKRLAQRKLRPGCVLIKYFKHIAGADINALFPNVRVMMSKLDMLVIGLPALLGGIPIILKLASTVTVLFLVAGFYLGVSGAVQENELKGALAAMSGLVALGGFMVRQWMKYQRQTLLYQMELTDNVYFRNVNNNAGIFDSLIGAAEQQECKEAFLAYYFILTAPEAPTQHELDARIEAWLEEAFDIKIDFEVDDALAKLDRLGILQRHGERLSVPPLTEALSRLRRVWTGYHQAHDIPDEMEEPEPAQKPRTARASA
jgi:hypothetical protein